MIESIFKHLGVRLKSTDRVNGILRRNPLFYPKIYNDLEELANASLTVRENHAMRRLPIFLKTASSTKYGKTAGKGLDISEWPILSKDLVRDNPEWFRVRTIWPSVPASTGGTTGLPLKVRRSFSSIAAEQVVVDRILCSRELEPRTARIAVLRGDTIKDPSDKQPPFWRFSGNKRRLLLSAHHLSEKTIISYVSAIRDFEPDCLMAYPSSLESLCALMRDNAKELKIPVVLTSSEMLFNETRKLAKEVLGCQLVDLYGQAERVVSAISMNEGQYFFVPGYSFVELLFDSTSDSFDFYEVVGTNYLNTAMPLVRYRTGDLIRLPRGISAEELKNVCYGIEPFSGVEGRRSDYIISPEGVRLIAMNHIPRDVERVIQMQLIQDSMESVRILVVPAKGFKHSDREKIIMNARSKFPDTMNVKVELVESLMRTKQGKVPFVIRNT